MNDRLTNKDIGLLKGALRKAFSRSELRDSIIEAAVVQYSHPSRPKVKTWVRCNVCKLPEAKSYMVVDHIDPVIPITSSFKELGCDATVDRLWCDPANLQAICPRCHDVKTHAEKDAKKALKPPRVATRRAKKSLR